MKEWRELRSNAFAWSGHMVQNHTCWDACCTVGLPKQRQFMVDWYELLCVRSPLTVQFASEDVWFCTMWPDRAKGLLLPLKLLELTSTEEWPIQQHSPHEHCYKKLWGMFYLPIYKIFTETWFYLQIWRLDNAVSSLLSRVVLNDSYPIDNDGLVYRSVAVMMMGCSLARQNNEMWGIGKEFLDLGPSEDWTPTQSARVWQYGLVWKPNTIVSGE